MIMNLGQMDVGEIYDRELSNVSKQMKEKTTPVHIVDLNIFQTFHLMILSKEQ